MKDSMLKLICLVTAAMLTLCGCSWSSYEAPEVVKTEKAELVLASPLTHSGKLTSTDGSVIAEYVSSYPQFEENSQAAQRINNAFALLAEEAPIDMESIFNHIKTQLGEDWEDKNFSEPFHTITMEYSLIPTLDEYICFSSKYTISENGTEKVYPGVIMFLSSTGWSLNFESLFGENTKAATELLLSHLNNWCKDNAIPTDSLASLTSKSLNGSFGITKDQVFICFDPYYFSTQFSESITVYFSLSPFKNLLIEQAHK